ncbi:MAG: nitroreductase family deazaflavin-dependent oxidoreductase [Frankiales bacterium]|nr:nitroreductase family deazaflavin-dependent oxidoreductase [Frankiales bacterium]
MSTQPPTRGDQRVDYQFETPTREQIVAISAKHVSMMETSDTDETWIWVGMEHLLLHTVGRKSGNTHKVALPFWRDAGGHRVVVASFGGNPTDPAWFLNLSDTAANPEVLVRVQGGLFWSTPEILDGDDYDTVWSGIVADRPWYADYVTKSGARKIPLVRLPETRPASDA